MIAGLFLGKEDLLALTEVPNAITRLLSAHKPTFLRPTNLLIVTTLCIL